MFNPIQISKIATFSGHKDCIYALEEAQDGHFFTGSSDGMVVRWNIAQPEQGELIANVANSVYALHHLPQENQLLVGQNHEGVYQIDLQTNKILKSAKITTAQIFEIKTSDEYIFAATGDGHLIILSRADLSVVNKIQLSDKSARCIAINPSHGTYAVGFSDFTIKIFSFQNHQLLHHLQGHTNSVFALSYSPEGRYLVSGGRDASLKIWDCDRNYSLYQSIPAHLFAINSIKFDASGDFFASASMDKTIKIWDGHTFRLLKVIDKARYQSHTTSVNKVLWHGKQLLTASDDKKILLWDLGVR